MERERGYFGRGTFDELTKLPPAELEALRQREVEAIINRAPEHLRGRLRGLQFEIDAKRKAHKSALGSCLVICRMMQESLERLHAVLEGKPLPAPREPAKVIPFPHKSRDRPAG